MDLISIVVPIYNVEKYIFKCIDSLIKQTYQKIEIILIDDGSQDACGAICDNYASKDNRIIVVHKQNGGLSDARNVGISVSKGKYITFVDSDDFVSKYYVEHLYHMMIKTNSDMSIVHSLTFYDGDSPKIDEKNEIIDLKVISSEQAINNTLDIKLRQSAWGKMYRKSIFDSIKFPYGMLYEDLAVVFYLLEQCKLISIAKNQDYYYLIRQNSIMTSSFSIKQYYSFQPIDLELDFLIEKYPELSDKILARKLYEQFYIYYRFRKSDKRSDFNDEYKNLKNDIHHNIKRIKKLKNVKRSLAIRIISYKLGWPLFCLVFIIGERRIRKRMRG